MMSCPSGPNGGASSATGASSPPYGGPGLAMMQCPPSMSGGASGSGSSPMRRQPSHGAEQRQQQQQSHQQQRNVSAGGGNTSSGAGRWQEAYLELEQEKRRIHSDLRNATEEARSLAQEAESLREQIHAERQKREEREAEMARQVEELERESKNFNMRLVKAQMGDSAQHNGVTTIKKDVVGRTMELEKLMREFQQTYQDKLFSRVWSITSAMQTSCQKSDASAQIRMPADTAESLAPSLGPSLLQAATQPSAAESPEGGGGASSGTFLDPETQQALKRRLQSLGDVVVYSNDKFEACCASGRAIPPGALRVRPRRCDHVFLVECLMPYWAEGVCPVCRCSFAYERQQDAGFDESDKYSSVSTSVSQMQRMPARSNSSDFSRGPRSLRDGSAHRGRSASLSRASRRRKGGTQQGSPNDDARSEVSRPADRLPSPSRSVASVRSRASSAPRERDFDRTGNSLPNPSMAHGAAPQSPLQGEKRPL